MLLKIRWYKSHQIKSRIHWQYLGEYKVYGLLALENYSCKRQLWNSVWVRSQAHQARTCLCMCWVSWKDEGKQKSRHSFHIQRSAGIIKPKAILIDEAWTLLVEWVMPKSKDRLQTCEHNFERSCDLSNSLCSSSPLKRQMVHLPFIRFYSLHLW